MLSLHTARQPVFEASVVRVKSGLSRTMAKTDEVKLFRHQSNSVRESFKV